MNKVILLTANYKGQPLEIVKELVPKGFTLITMEQGTSEEFVTLVKDADYILASGNLKIDTEVLNAADNLKMIQRVGVGLDSLDADAIAKKNIPVYVNPGLNADSVAEHAIMFILACLRRLTVINNNTSHGIWKKQEQGVSARCLYSRTVGIFGMGNIGRRVAKLLGVFGCRVIYYDKYRLPLEDETALNIEYKSLDKMFEIADIITLHCPLTEETENVISKDSFDRMKSGVIIVNTSRGRLINEDDLFEALSSGKVGFAGLDVFREEPLKNLKLACCDNVICTPHIAGNTYDSFYSMIEHAIKNIRAFDEGRLADIESMKINFQEGK